MSLVHSLLRPGSDSQDRAPQTVGSERGRTSSDQPSPAARVQERSRHVPRPLPPLRRARDGAPFECPAFASAVGAALDHVVDGRLGLTYADTERICRLFLVHFIALGGRL